MKILSNKIFLIAIGLMLANLAYLIPYGLGSIVTLPYFLLIPGYLLLKALGANLSSKWETISLSSALSILILMVSGLFLSLLHTLGIERPLTPLHIFLLLDIVVAVLAAATYQKLNSFSLNTPKIPFISIFMISSLALLPFIAAGGASRLNNGASNILTLVLFAMIFILFMILIARQDLRNLYPYAIFCIGLSVLLTTSLRSSLISGHDIQHEFAVFQITFSNQFWSSTFPKGDPYNACLSITILPTMLANIATLPAPYIFKLVFQILFAIGLLPIFFFIKRLSNAKTALIASLIFISFPAYINDLPFLTRQEIAFIFFGMLMMVSFLKVSRTIKTTLTLLSIIGIILAHYSSGYVAIGILIIAYFIYTLLNRNFKTKQITYIPILKPSIIALALVLTFMWNSQITTSTHGLKNTVLKTVQGLYGDSATATGVSYSLFAPPAQSPTIVLAKFAGSSATQVFYNPSGDLPLTKVGKAIDKVVRVNALNTNIRTFCAKILQLLLLIGMVIMFLRIRRNATVIQLYCLSLSFACLSLLVMITVLPEISTDYGVTRLFQQTLIITALPIVIATEFFLKRTRFKLILPGLFFGILFLDLSGFIPQVLGGYPAQYALNNSGINYNIYYHHQGEAIAGKWLSNQGGKLSIAADSYTANRLPKYPYAKEYIRNPIIANQHTAYLFQGNTNATKKLYASFLSGNLIEYNYFSPIENGNLLYVNKYSRIYHE